MFPYGGACFEADSGWFICALSPGCQCIGTPCSGLDRAETTLVGRRDLFQAKWMRRLEKASLELLRIWMKFAYLIYFSYLCANNMQEQTVIYLWKYCFLLFIERIILSNSIPFKLLSLFFNHLKNSLDRHVTMWHDWTMRTFNLFIVSENEERGSWKQNKYYNLNQYIIWVK